VIYPTRRAILLAAAGAPVCLAVGLLAPGLWRVAAGWLALTVALVLADLLLAADPRRMQLSLSAPATLGLGETGAAQAACECSARLAPRRLEFALEVTEKLAAHPERASRQMQGGHAGIDFRLEPLRRGEGTIRRLWARWRGPLGLIWRQKTETLDRVIALSPNIAAVKREAMRLYARDAQFGEKIQIDRGEGSEFQALAEFRAGMDTRTIDWKRSARHTSLLAKEFRVEKNHNVVFALDVSRQMSDPLAGVARIDHAINAAVLLAFVSLKMGDRAGLFAFDSKPRISMRPSAGAMSFPLLQRRAAALDYSAEEVNYTLALTTLGGSLQRRSLVVVFTEFVDSTSAELMIESLARLAQRHLVLFVAFRDEELEQLTRREPQSAEDVTRAVIALTLLKERETVIARLRRLGVQVMDAPVEGLGPTLVNRYLDLKRRELL
jgi:uncharacterized protein (DUF58 family)